MILIMKPFVQNVIKQSRNTIQQKNEKVKMKDIFEVPSFAISASEVKKAPVYKREHAFCESCGSGMKIELKSGGYSGWTGNKIFYATAYCPNCKENETFMLKKVFECKTDKILYTSDFYDLQDYFDNKYDQKQGV